MGFTDYTHGITSFGIPIYGNGQQDISGSTYFVDNNSGSDGNDGFTLPYEFRKQAVFYRTHESPGTIIVVSRCCSLLSRSTRAKAGRASCSAAVARSDLRS